MLTRVGVQSTFLWHIRNANTLRLLLDGPSIVKQALALPTLSNIPLQSNLLILACMSTGSRRPQTCHAGDVGSLLCLSLCQSALLDEAIFLGLLNLVKLRSGSMMQIGEHFKCILKELLSASVEMCRS